MYVVHSRIINHLVAWAADADSKQTRPKAEVSWPAVVACAEVGQTSEAVALKLACLMSLVIVFREGTLAGKVSVLMLAVCNRLRTELRPSDSHLKC